jgi:hypothetical protein
VGSQGADVPSLPPTEFSVLGSFPDSVQAGDAVTVTGSSLCSYLQLILDYSVAETGEQRVSRRQITGTGDKAFFSFKTSLEIPPRAAGPATLYLDQACQAADDELIASTNFIIEEAPARATPAQEKPLGDLVPVIGLILTSAVVLLALILVLIRRRSR